MYATLEKPDHGDACGDGAAAGAGACHAHTCGKAAGTRFGGGGERPCRAGGDRRLFPRLPRQRETARADEIALLDEIVHREGAPEESVREADARRIELTRQTEQERAIETQLVAKALRTRPPLCRRERSQSS